MNDRLLRQWGFVDTPTPFRFERDIILERTQAGLRAARARGRKGGRPRPPSTSRKIELARKLYDERKTPTNDICRGLNISRATLYRYLKTRAVLSQLPADPGGKPGGLKVADVSPLVGLEELRGLIRR